MNQPATSATQSGQSGNSPLPAPRYNIPPSEPVLAVRRRAGQQGRECVPLRWGLIPPWAADPRIGNRLINARAETAADRPAFREAFRLRRCLVPADGFFVWKRLPDGRREPSWVHRRDGKPFAFAALWERWQGPKGEVIESCAILTVPANDLVRPFQPRMPAILGPEDFDAWLDRDLQDPERIEALLRPYPAEELAARPVSPHANDAGHDDPGCLAPREPSRREGFLF